MSALNITSGLSNQISAKPAIAYFVLLEAHDPLGFSHFDGLESYRDTAHRAKPQFVCSVWEFMEEFDVHRQKACSNIGIRPMVTPDYSRSPSLAHTRCEGSSSAAP